MTFSLDLDTSIDIMLAITLSAATGFRVFVPLLILSAAAVFGHIDLPSKFDWIENPQALTLFGTAATTGGLANPIFALLELAISTCLSLLAITLPLVAGAICEAGAYAIAISLLSFALYKITTKAIDVWNTLPQRSN